MSRYKTSTKGAVIYLVRRRSNLARWTFIAIIVFVVILVPIYGTTLRYDVSITLRLLLSAIGELCLTLGAGLFLVSALLSLYSKRIYVKSMIIAVVLLWIAACLTGGQFTLWGNLIGPDPPSQGYH